jgi:hypothetical protein
VLAHASAVFIAEDEQRAVHLAMTEVVVPDDDEDENEGDEDDESEDDENEDGENEDDDTTATTEGDE